MLLLKVHRFVYQQLYTILVYSIAISFNRINKFSRRNIQADAALESFNSILTSSLRIFFTQKIYLDNFWTLEIHFGANWMSFNHNKAYYVQLNHYSYFLHLLISAQNNCWESRAKTVCFHFLSKQQIMGVASEIWVISFDYFFSIYL